MIRLQFVQAGLALFLVAGVGACGGDAAVRVEQSTQISKGWEVKDLQRALDKGAVTPEEYERIRQKLLKRNN